LYIIDHRDVRYLIDPLSNPYPSDTTYPVITYLHGYIGYLVSISNS